MKFFRNCAIIACLFALLRFGYAATQTINTLPSADATFIATLQTFLGDELANYTHLRFDDVVISGGIGTTDADLVNTVSALVAFPNGFYVSQAATSHTYSANTRTFVFVRDSDSRTIAIAGAAITYDDYFVFAEAAASTARPSTPNGCLPLFYADTDGTSITAITDERYLTSVGGVSLAGLYDCDIAGAVSDIGSTETRLLVDCATSIADGETVTTNANTNVYAVAGGTIDTNTTGAIVFGGPFNGDTTQHFIGDGVKFGSNTFTIYPEWFGCVGDDATDCYPAVLSALKAMTSLNTAHELVFNSSKNYVIDNGANPGFLFDADSLPDTTITGGGDQSIPSYTIEGTMPPLTPANGNSPQQGYIKFTGTGNGITVTGGTVKWRGKLHFKNLLLYGDETADIGLSLDYADLYNTFEDIDIAQFSGSGMVIGSNSTFTMHFTRVKSYKNGGAGFEIDGNAYEFWGCEATRNGGGGVLFNGSQLYNINWWGGVIEFNVSPQVSFTGGSTNVQMHNFYIEGQLDSGMGGDPVTGERRGLIEITGSDHIGLSFSGRLNAYTLATDDNKEHYTFKITNSNIYSCEFGPIASKMATAANDTYIFNDYLNAGSTVTASFFRSIWFSNAGSTTSTFEGDNTGFWGVEKNEQFYFPGGTTVGSTGIIDTGHIDFGNSKETDQVTDAGQSFTPSYNTYNAYKIEVTTNDNFMLVSPSGAKYGARLTIDVYNTSGGAMGAITWGNAYKLEGGAFTNPATGYHRVITFTYVGGRWRQSGGGQADIPE